MLPEAPLAPSGRDAFSWISLGAVCAACVLCLAIWRTNEVTAFVSGILPGTEGQNLVLPVRAGGAVVAAGLVLAGIMLRRAPLDGRSAAAWLHLTATLGALAVAMTIVRSLRGRPITVDMWIVFAAVSGGPLRAFWQARGRSVRKATSQ